VSGTRRSQSDSFDAAAADKHRPFPGLIVIAAVNEGFRLADAGVP
jgi:hypothetical protein